MMEDGKSEQEAVLGSQSPSSTSHHPYPSRDPLHGVTLAQIVQHLHAEYGWDELARRVPVKCFQQQPSVSSSLKFLRKEGWAREQVEREYLNLIHREDGNPVIDAVKRGQPVNTAGISQTKLHAALGWLLRHVPQNAQNLKSYFLPTLAAIQDVQFWPDAANMPLLNLAIEHSRLGQDDYEPTLIEELLRRGADANDARYWLPLMHTVDIEGEAYRNRTRAPRTDILDLLLKSGATVELADARGRTALQIAQAYDLKAAIHKLTPEPVEKSRRRVVEKKALDS